MEDYNKQTKDDLIVELLRLKTEVEHLSAHILHNSLSFDESMDDYSFDDELPEAVVEMDLKGFLYKANSAAYRLFGYETSIDLKKINVLDVIDKPDHERAMDNIHKVVFNRELGSNKYMAVKADGTKFPVVIHSAPIKRDGSTVGMRVMAFDISKVMGAEQQLRDHNKILEEEVKSRTELLLETNDKLLTSVEQTIKALADTVALRDPYTASHQERVADLACAIGKRLGFDEDRLKCLYLAGVIHDIGKIHIPSEILCKPTKLSDVEFELIKTHSQRGYDILQNIDLPWPIDDILIQHHEKIDGSGYPDGLTGDQILAESKIIAVADVVEAVSSHRPYRAALGIDTALEIIKEGQGTLFDPQVVEACEAVFNEENYRFSE